MLLSVLSRLHLTSLAPRGRTRRQGQVGAESLPLFSLQPRRRLFRCSPNQGVRPLGATIRGLRCNRRDGNIDRPGDPALRRMRFRRHCEPLPSKHAGNQGTRSWIEKWNRSCSKNHYNQIKIQFGNFQRWLFWPISATFTTVSPAAVGGRSARVGQKLCDKNLVCGVDQGGENRLLEKVQTF